MASPVYSSFDAFFKKYIFSKKNIYLLNILKNSIAWIISSYLTILLRFEFSIPSSMTSSLFISTFVLIFIFYFVTFVDTILFGTTSSLTFEEFIDNMNEQNDYAFSHGFITQYNQLLDENNEIHLDYVGRFENLNEEIVNYLLKINVPYITHYKSILNGTKINSTGSNENYYKYYNEKTMNLNSDIDYFQHKIKSFSTFYKVLYLIEF
jgi:hypothetical protein